MLTLRNPTNSAIRQQARIAAFLVAGRSYDSVRSAFRSQWEGPCPSMANAGNGIVYVGCAPSTNYIQETHLRTVFLRSTIAAMGRKDRG